MTKLETTIRQVSDLRDFYLKVKKQKSKNHKTGTTRGCSRRAKARG
jgi:hypothetical protein